MENHVKVVYLVSRLTRSGTNIQLYSLVSNINRRFCEPVIVTIYGELDDSMKRDFMNLGISIYSLGLKRTNLMFLRRKLNSILNDISPDIVHTSCFSADFAGSVFLGKYKTCTTVHSNPKNYYVVTYGKFLGNILSSMHMNAIKHLNFPVACSNSISKEMEEIYNSKTYVIQNGIDMEKFSLVDSFEKNNIRKKLGLSQDKRLFIYVGSLDNRKDPITLIKAFIRSNLDGKSKLLILGSGPLEEACKDISNDSVLFLGRVENVREYLWASDVFVSASTSEGLPMAVLEAMGTGKPVILSNIGPHMELFSKNERIGNTFETKDVNALSELFIKYSEVSLDELERNSRSEIEENYNSKIMSERYYKLYETMLAN